MKPSDEQLIYTGVFILGVLAACLGHWDVVSLVLGGAFALLKGERKE